MPALRDYWESPGECVHSHHAVAMTHRTQQALGNTALRCGPDQPMSTISLPHLVTSFFFQVVSSCAQDTLQCWREILYEYLGSGSTSVARGHPPGVLSCHSRDAGIAAGSEQRRTHRVSERFRALDAQLTALLPLRHFCLRTVTSPYFSTAFSGLKGGDWAPLTGICVR